MPYPTTRGFGKSTTTADLAHALSARKKRVLIIVDADSQCNPTSTFLGSPWGGHSLLELLDGDGVAAETCIIPAPDYERLHVLPNKTDSAALEPALVRRDDYGWYMLRDRLRGHAAKTFDFTLIDCPPNLGLFSIQAMLETLRTSWPCLARAGFGLEQLEQIQSALAQLGKSTDRVVQGLDHAEWELAKGRIADKTGQPVADPCAWVFRSLASQGYYRRPAGYVSAEEQAELDAAKQAAALALSRENARQARFKAWMLDLSRQEREKALEGRKGPEETWLKIVCGSDAGSRPSRTSRKTSIAFAGCLENPGRACRGRDTGVLPRRAATPPPRLTG